MKRFALFALLMTTQCFALAGTEIKTNYINDRFFVTVPFNGVEAELLLDSGGNTGIYPEFAWYWKAADSKVVKGRIQFGATSPFQSFPEDSLQKNSIRVMPSDDEEASMIRKLMRDGILGHSWLGTRTWTFDYPSKRLILQTSSYTGGAKKTDISFKNDQLFYPRMTITVDEQPLQVLFDTGGTSFFSEAAMKELGLSEAFSASSFIRKSVFDSWRTKHPDWKFIDGGDRMGGNPLIRVPSLRIAGHEVGPTWFAMRPDKAYDEYMAEYMDCKCAGAIGGNVFKNFRITLDYKKKTAWFEKP